MKTEEYIRSVCNLKHEYGETDPFRLCKEMGILLIRMELGIRPDAIKGFYREILRVRTIVVNSCLPDFIQKIIVAHELGHVVLHRCNELHAFQGFNPGMESSLMEREANLFAAELLLDDEEVKDILRNSSSLQEAAARLYVPVELLQYKCRILKSTGYWLPEIPFTARADFLKNMPVPVYTEYGF